MEPSAAKLLLPYLGWTLFASALTYNIWANNTKGKVRSSVDRAPATPQLCSSGAAAL